MLCCKIPFIVTKLCARRERERDREREREREREIICKHVKSSIKTRIILVAQLPRYDTSITPCLKHFVYYRAC